MAQLKVFIGYDRREHRAYEVAVASLKKHSSIPIEPTCIELGRNTKWGLILRPRRIAHGQLWDVISDAPMSTEFAISRFLTPLLAQSGWALFTDCDVVFQADVQEIMSHADESKAVMCVQHAYRPRDSDLKMDGQKQTSYARKNWSSVTLWNCDHPANQQLTIDMINSWSGLNLHQFGWLNPVHIGALPAEWNWLVGEQPKPADVKIAHFTRGGPWLPNWIPKEHDELWINAERDVMPQGNGHDVLTSVAL